MINKFKNLLAIFFGGFLLLLVNSCIESNEKIIIDIDDVKSLQKYIQGKWEWEKYNVSPNETERYRFEIIGNQIKIWSCVSNVKDPFDMSGGYEELTFSWGNPKRDIDGYHARSLEFSVLDKNNFFGLTYENLAPFWVVSDAEYWDEPQIKNGGGIPSWSRAKFVSVGNRINNASSSESEDNKNNNYQNNLSESSTSSFQYNQIPAVNGKEYIFKEVNGQDGKYIAVFNNNGNQAKIVYKYADYTENIGTVNFINGKSIQRSIGESPRYATSVENNTFYFFAYNPESDNYDAYYHENTISEFNNNDFEHSNTYTEAQFPSGQTGLNNFISSNLIYPQQAIELGITGRVIVAFNVSSDGTLSNIRIKNGVDALIDNEALRIVRKMPRWTPAKSNNNPISTEEILPINFKLN